MPGVIPVSRTELAATSRNRTDHHGSTMLALRIRTDTTHSGTSSTESTSTLDARTLIGQAPTRRYRRPSADL